MALTGPQFSAYFILMCVGLYVLHALVRDGRVATANEDDDEEDWDEEGFDGPPADTPSPPPTPVAADATTPARDDQQMQSIIDFSDVTATEAQRKEWRERQENAKQIQSVNERFNAAKRKTNEHSLKPGVMPNKKRRQLVESIVRRPYCGRRSRSWRTAFSDILRGDVVPKGQSSWNMMRIGRSDPAVDLHPGALGTMSGLSGQWVSDADVPENAFEDFPENA